MRKFFFYTLTAIAAIFIIPACDYLCPDPDITQNGLKISNDKGLDGTYFVVGPHNYYEKVTNQLPTPTAEGEYRVFFTNAQVDGNVCFIDGKEPIFMGNTKFEVSYEHKIERISVPVGTITCWLSFKEGNGVKFSKAIIKNVPTSIFIDGEVNRTNDLTLYGDSYVIASRLHIFVSIDVTDGSTPPIKVVETTIDAQPGHKYVVKLEKDGASISDL